MWSWLNDLIPSQFSCRAIIQCEGTDMDADEGVDSTYMVAYIGRGWE